MFRNSLALLALVAPFAAEAAAPALIPVTGYLTDTTGAPINDTVTLHLKLYGATGTELWAENQSVDVDNGQFTVYLGDVTAVDLQTFRDNGILSLGVAVGTGAEMSPRFDLATAPFAAYAEYCDEAATVGGIDPLDIQLAGDPVNWTTLQGVPADLLDGDQGGTTYVNGNGLNLTGTTFSVDQLTVENWAKNVAYDSITELRADLDAVYMAKMACTANQVLMADTTGAFVCTDTSTFGPNEATVDGYVADNGYAAASALATTATALTTLTGRVATVETDITALKAADLPKPVIWYDANNTASYPGTGSVWRDLSGNGVPAALQSCSAWGVLGGINTMIFNRTDCAKVLFANKMLDPDVMTGVYWVYSRLTTADNDGGGLYTNQTTNAANAANWIWFGKYAADSWYFRVNNGAGCCQDLTGSGTGGTWASRVPANRWVMVHFAYANGGTWKWGANGASAYTGTLPYRPTTQTMDTSAIGVGHISSGSYWDGGISSVRFYNEMLSDAQLLALYNATKGAYGL